MRQKIRAHLETRARLAEDRRSGVGFEELRARYPRIYIRAPLGRDHLGRFARVS